MHAAEQGPAVVHLVGGAKPGDHLVERGGPAHAGQPVHTIVLDALNSHAGTDRQRPPGQSGGGEAGDRLGIAQIVFDQARIAADAGATGAGRVAVDLQARLALIGPAQAGLRRHICAQGGALPGQAALGAPGDILSQAALVAACGVEIGHAAAGRIAGVVGPLTGARRLAPPVPIEPSVMDRRLQLERLGDPPAVCRGGSHAVAREGVVCEGIGAWIGGELSLRQAGIGDLTVLGERRKA